MTDPFTRLGGTTSGSGSFDASQPLRLTANLTGVTSASDTTNTTISAIGDGSLTGKFRVGEFQSDEGPTVTSDPRTKYDPRPLPLQQSTAIIRQSQPLHYKLKKNDKDGIGYNAFDMEKVEESLIVIGKDGMYSVKYGDMQIHTTHVVKHLLERMEQLQKKLYQMEPQQTCTPRPENFRSEKHSTAKKNVDPTH